MKDNIRKLIIKAADAIRINEGIKEFINRSGIPARFIVGGIGVDWTREEIDDPIFISCGEMEGYTTGEKGIN